MNPSDEERSSMMVGRYSSPNVAGKYWRLQVVRDMRYYQPIRDSKLNPDLMSKTDEGNLKYPSKGLGSLSVQLSKD